MSDWNPSSCTSSACERGVLDAFTITSMRASTTARDPADANFAGAAPGADTFCEGGGGATFTTSALDAGTLEVLRCAFANSDGSDEALW